MVCECLRHATVACAAPELTACIHCARAFAADSCVRRAAALCEDGAEAWTCTRHGGQSAAALAAAAGHAATDARVRAKLAALAGAVAEAGFLAAFRMTPQAGVFAEKAGAAVAA